MRFIALFPLLCVIGAFVLSLLAILAGMRADFMENFELLTFNTSELGITLVNKTIDAAANAGPTPIPTSVRNNIPPSATSSIPAPLASEIAGLNVAQIAQELAQDLNIHDFYKLHILDYCEGYYEPGPIINSTNQNPTQNLTYCSPAAAFSFFNATDVLDRELKTGPTGVTLDQIQWPQQVQDAINGFAIAQKAMFVLYVIGCAFAGFAVLMAIVAFLSDGRFSAICNAILDILAFIALAVASGLATGFMYVVTAAVNQYGSQVNVQVYKGTNFLIITWIATALCLIASTGWCVDCCIGPDRRRSRGKW